jgi:hypothetical protein
MDVTTFFVFECKGREEGGGGGVFDTQMRKCKREGGCGGGSANMRHSALQMTLCPDSRCCFCVLCFVFLSLCLFVHVRCKSYEELT